MIGSVYAMPSSLWALTESSLPLTDAVVHLVNRSAEPVLHALNRAVHPVDNAVDLKVSEAVAELSA
jgi:hypothetical protein